LTRSWFEKEDPKLTDRLLEELPGILLWAIEGWRRLRERGRFVQPDSARDLLGQLEDLTSPIGEVLRECCLVGQEYSVLKAKLFEKWQMWCSKNGRERPGDAATFGRNLLAALPEVKQSQPRDGEKRVPTYVGVGLRGG